MSLQEIKAALPSLTLEELRELDRALEGVTSARANGTQVFTGADAIAWWNEIEHMDTAEADAFAADIANARAEVQR